MPFLRAALIANKQPEKKYEKPAKVIRTLEDLTVAMAVKAWIAYDDRATAREAALLGL